MGLRTWLENLHKKVLVFWHLKAGAYQFRRGDLTKATYHYLSVVDSGVPSFQAHLTLGRIYLQQERDRPAMEQLQSAREMDPHRFARYFPFDPRMWIADRLQETRQHQSLGAAGRGASEGYFSYPENAAAGAMSHVEPDDLPFGDFYSRDERDRFALLPPIALSDAEEIDWDQLGRQLIEEED